MALRPGLVQDSLGGGGASTDNLIVSHLVEAPASLAPTPGQKEYVDGRAIIGYQSLLDSADIAIAATSAASGYPASAIKSRLTAGGWRPSANGAQYLTFTGSRGHKADYLVLAGHNLASKGAVIDLEYHDGTSWLSMLSGHAPVSDSPIMLLFTQREALAYRLRVDVAGVAYPTIATVLLGARLSLQRGIYVGHNPAPYSPDVDFVTEESEGGNIVGSTVLSTSFSTSVSLRRITPTWFRAYMAPFLLVARRKTPFAFMWNTDDRYKGEVIYGTLTNRPSFGNEHQSFMGGDLEIRGLA